ncbi:PrsW family intramembrane metalloprotease [Candidatus Wolfebacteria bacterium]|nr:PrsW family intramembrane metalloprotease [Candidatus Wolfebacteria bacterium]
MLKFLVVYAIIHKNKYFDEPIDAMIYMVVAALGFALVENIAVVAVAKNIPDAVGTLTLRFVGATLLHALSSGIIGYYWAKSIIHKKTLKFLITIILGILIASVIHAAFNYLIVAIKDVIIYPTLFLIVVALIVFWDFEKIKKEEAAQ